jgi:hypothetical protein
MVTIVIAVNLLTACIGFFVAWRVWQLQRTIAKIADTLAAAERSTHQLLHNAPTSIARGQLGVYQLRQAYVQSGPQWLRVRRALTLLGLGRSLWWGSNRRSSLPLRRGVRAWLRKKRRSR